MTDVHPSWHATNDDANPPLSKISTSRNATHIPVSKNVTVSRLPAAILGILTVVLIGVLYSRGMFSLKSDVTTGVSDPLKHIAIHLTENGTDPSEVHALPGQIITWINDRSTPQILQSDTLKDGSGNTLYSPLIQPGSSLDFMVSPTQEPGTLTYGSLTSKSTNGTVIIDSVPVAPIVSSISSISSLVTTPLMNATGTFLVTQSSSIPSQVARVPHNPYTVTSHYIRPLDAMGNPILSSSSSPSLLHAGAPLMPKEQPKSGPEIWVTISLSALAMLWFMRRKQTAFTA